MEDNTNNIVMVPVEKTDDDAKLIMKWRNDPITMKNSLNQKEKVWKDFRNEFYNHYFNNIPLFATLNGVKIGFISFCKIDDGLSLLIGINLDPMYRGKGLSKKVVNAAIIYIKAHYSEFYRIIAEIKDSNMPSIRLFESSNFKFDSELDRTIDGEKVHIFKYIYTVK